MEQFLNLIWLLASIAGIAWVVGSSSQHSRFGPGVRLIALVCLAVVLFPFISATDDLHALQMPTEQVRNQDVIKKLLSTAIISAVVTVPVIATVLTGVWSCLQSWLPPLTGSRARATNIFRRPPPARSICPA